MGVAPCGRDLYDAMRERHRRHSNSTLIQSLNRSMLTSKIQAPEVRVRLVLYWLQFELGIQRRDAGGDGDHRIQVEL
jgi:hypothetical protein